MKQKAPIPPPPPGYTQHPKHKHVAFMPDATGVIFLTPRQCRSRTAVRAMEWITLPVPNLHSTGYYKISVDGTSKNRHRLVWETFNGRVIDGEKDLVIDHIDGSKTNDCLSNLRLMSRTDNTNRAVKKCGSLPKHIYRHGNGYRASFRRKGKMYSSPNFFNLEEAEAVVLNLMDSIPSRF